MWDIGIKAKIHYFQIERIELLYFAIKSIRESLPSRSNFKLHLIKDNFLSIDPLISAFMFEQFWIVFE